MGGSPTDWLAPLERAELQEQWGALAYASGRGVAVDAAERNGALRRAALLLAAGGDPRRPLELDARAVSAVAADLDDPERRAALAEGLAELAPALAGLERLSAALEQLRADPDLAWRAFSLALLADALADDA